MKKAKAGMMAQIMAWLALFAIVIGIVGTGLLVVFSGGQEAGDVYSGNGAQDITQEDLQRIIEQSTPTVEVQTKNVETTDIETIEVEAIDVTSSGTTN